MSGQFDSTISYSIKLLPERHEVEVELALEGPVANGNIDLALPTWVPGDYEFRRIGRDVFNVRATCQKNGSVLNVRPEGWQGYRVENGSGAVIVDFTVYCSSTDFAESCGILDDIYGVLLGTRYLYPIAHTGSCRVTFQLPTGWPIHCPSGPRQIDERTWEFPSHELLVGCELLLIA